MYVGEDTALAERARAMGVPYVAAPEVLTWHAVVEVGLLKAIRGTWRWQGLALLVRRHPRMRQEFFLWMFWHRRHVWLPVAAVGWAAMRRSRLAVLLIAPYAAHTFPRRPGSTPRARLRSLVVWPAWIAIDVAEFVALAWGSVKHRSPFL
jgi:GT2 family glycosyltransferase